ncbi:hypothetical protein MGN70_008237 [Eutypa lata]|nr:hypothetical protein MGN70_008237 [Eutypa lata]
MIGDVDHETVREDLHYRVEDNTFGLTNVSQNGFDQLSTLVLYGQNLTLPHWARPQDMLEDMWIGKDGHL